VDSSLAKAADARKDSDNATQINNKNFKFFTIYTNESYFVFCISGNVQEPSSISSRG
jgi:hypothetical protein